MENKTENTATKRVIFDLLADPYKRFAVDIDAKQEITGEWISEQIKPCFKIPEIIEFYWLVPQEKGFFVRHGRTCGTLTVR